MPDSVCSGARSAHDSSAISCRCAAFVVAVSVTVIGAILRSAAFGWVAAELAGLHPATIALGMPRAELPRGDHRKGASLGVPLVTSFHVGARGRAGSVHGAALRSRAGVGSAGLESRK
jgi:hypothetical protein